MKVELLNFLIFLRAIAEVLAMTGIGVGVVIVLVAEKFRIVEVGIEQVRSENRPLALKTSGDGQLAIAAVFSQGSSSRGDWATSPSRKVRTA